MACTTPVLLPASIPNAQIGVLYNQPLTIGGFNASYGIVGGLISYSALSNPFNPNTTVVGAISGATALILTNTFGFPNGTFYVANITGVFIAGETLNVALPTPRTAVLDSIVLYPAPAGLSVINTSVTDGAITGTSTAPFTDIFFVYAFATDNPVCPAGINQYSFTVSGGAVTLIPANGDDICGSLSEVLAGSGKCFHLFISGKNRWGLLVCGSAPTPPVQCGNLCLGDGETIPCSGDEQLLLGLTLPPATPFPVNIQLQGFGGVAPYTFVVISGALPTLVTMTPSGLISGLCPFEEDDSFRVQVTDSLGVTGCQDFLISFAWSITP